ncbi:hypothetical protein BDZ88DRAFT_195887 [Geranomyces variabilis]|nr:hypothetical protein BDZ88DRAFT_195887 [Geranomyces variabilis]KAJ3140250.1 hypothetical protein HDU90_008477 [Geranomyces variabilis]
MTSSRVFLESKQARENRAFADSPFSSTARASYKPHDVKAVRKEERFEYEKNKSKARHAGEWWNSSQSASASSAATSKPETNYHDSFRSHNYAEWLRSVAKLPVAGNKSAPNDGAGTLYAGGPSDSAKAGPSARTVQTAPAASNGGDLMDGWSQYRVRKAVRDTSGTRYDIITGYQLGSNTSFGRPAHRVSFDKMAADRNRDRGYDIISNVKLVSSDPPSAEHGLTA